MTVDRYSKVVLTVIAAALVVIAARPLTPSTMLKSPQAAQNGPDARRRPMAAREAYSLYVERAAEGANEADGPFSAARSSP